MKLIALLLGIALSNFYFAHTDSLAFSEETMDYFKEIALRKTKNTVISTWKKDITVFIHPGNKEPVFLKTDPALQNEYKELEKELDQVLNELNNLISTIQLTRVNTLEEANLEIYVGSVKGCRLLDASTRNSLTKNWAIQHCRLSTDNKDITHGFVFLDFYRTPNIRVKKRLLRKKVTQSLGLFNESDEIKESIFFDGFSEQSNYVEIDKELIQILYNHPEVTSQLPCKSIPIDWATNQSQSAQIKTNPIQDEVIFLVSDELLNETVRIYNSQGQVVHFQNIESNEIHVPFTDFGNGMYYIQIKNREPTRFLKMSY
ncbi:MAG: DUF2927 domain-containing protein [Crocinitomicaceae bacterium]|nr:DUF2927 domain-containing protein [Crocinitomicaceae bacterium]MCF8410492.1 DUF2927 domain-containing protein [Crocinitomicaceae bacterium]MCF8443941.1 DUF2927 domain-containing protein [Crocinitomicaceae bacterium]